SAAMVRMRSNNRLHILADGPQKRIGVLSFYAEGIHHNLLVRLLNDHYGIQVRGGCSCAGTYGHYLLDVTHKISSSITREIDLGDLTHKPGWVRLSLHPTMTDAELEYVMDALDETLENADKRAEDYRFDPCTGEFRHHSWKKPSLDWLAWD
ncbi:MAG: aminotransferase class V-fold PLP-dependent enzyme, partial [Spirochaetaceae bacterium]|nr:aminotransferase class V-fold PLP-dependent enzyme [Spirochaetaceae bacterium]